MVLSSDSYKNLTRCSTLQDQEKQSSRDSGFPGGCFAKHRGSHISIFFGDGIAIRRRSLPPASMKEGRSPVAKDCWEQSRLKPKHLQERPPLSEEMVELLYNNAHKQFYLSNRNRLAQGLFDGLPRWCISPFTSWRGNIGVNQQNLYRPISPKK